MKAPKTWLAVDTSTYVSSVAVWRAGTVLASRSLDAPLPGPGLIGEIEAALATAGMTVSDIESFAIGLGPGAFTSLRVGLATVKGLAYALARPLTGVMSLEALARRARRLGAVGVGELCVTVLDARRGEVYAAAFDAGGQRVLTERAVSPESLGVSLTALAGDFAAIRTVGAGAVLFRDRIGALARPTDVPSLASPCAEEVAELAALAWPEGALSGAAQHALAPCYVRAADAEVKKT